MRMVGIFSYGWVICISFFPRTIFFTSFLIALYFFSSIFKSSLYIQDINNLSFIWVANIFPIYSFWKKFLYGIICHGNFLKFVVKFIFPFFLNYSEVCTRIWKTLPILSIYRISPMFSYSNYKGSSFFPFTWVPDLFLRLDHFYPFFRISKLLIQNISFYSLIWYAPFKIFYS